MSMAMGKEEREAFLRGLHVGVIGVVEEEGRAPLLVPVWYDVTDDGEVFFLTQSTSRKAKAIARAGRFSLCVQDESTPYKYVAVEGSVTGVTPSDNERDLRPMARRYLGEEGGDDYVASVAGGDADDAVIRMRPEHWVSADYGKQGG